MTPLYGPNEPDDNLNREKQNLSQFGEQFHQQMVEVFNSAARAGKDLLQEEVFNFISKALSQTEKDAKGSARNIASSYTEEITRRHRKEQAGIERLKRSMIRAADETSGFRLTNIRKIKEEKLKSLQEWRQQQIQAIDESGDHEGEKARDKKKIWQKFKAEQDKIQEASSQTLKDHYMSSIKAVGSSITTTFGEATKMANVENILVLGFRQAMRRSVAEAEATAGLIQAGVSGPGGGRMPVGGAGIGEARRHFGGLMSEISRLGPTVMTPTQRIQTLNRALHVTPRVMEETSANIGEFTGFLGYMGIKIPESMQQLARATRDADLGAQDLIETYESASVVADDWGATISDVSSKFINMQVNLRGVGAGLETVNRIAAAMPTEALGRRLAPAEMQQMADALGQFLGQLSPAKLGGMVAFMEGSIPGSEGLIQAGKEPFELMGDMFQRISSQFDESQQMYVTQGFAQQMGIPAQTLQEVEMLNKILTEPGEDIEARLKEEGLQSTEDIMRDGFNQLSNMVDPMERISNMLQNTIAPAIDPIAKFFTALGPEAAHLIISAIIGRAALGTVGIPLGLAAGAAFMPETGSPAEDRVGIPRRS